MSKTEQTINNLMYVAQRTNDAEALYQIAMQLEKLSAWQEAREVERMADEIENEEAARRMVSR